MGLLGGKDKEPAKPDTKNWSLAQSLEAFKAQKGKLQPSELATRLATVILEYGTKLGASDLHFDPVGDEIQVRFRVDGLLYDQISFPKADFPVTSRLRVMADFPPQAGSQYSAEDGRFELTIDGRPVQFRASAFPTAGGEKLVLRVLDMGQTALGLEHLGFAPAVLAKLKEVIASPNGIMFVAGKTGSGKTTTLCSVLTRLNQPEVNIMTLEDPVEYMLPRVSHAQVNVKAGFTFAEGLRTIFRQDPNVIMVGEVRDRETAEIALRAAMTGHLIFSTLHATTTTGVVNRLVGMEIEPYMISSAFIAALAQRLVRKVCQKCGERVPLDEERLAAMTRKIGTEQAEAIHKLAHQPQGKFFKARGCPECNNTGYRGRTGVHELLVMDDRLRAFIRKDFDGPAMRRAAIQSGMQTLLMDAVTKAWAGWTTLDEVQRVAAD